uniref:Uncharacterized protein n=1 Tax=Kalanchoe fedtschenkoi TaxID=63787 RepID=A0A7N0RI05_KALFE
MRMAEEEEESYVHGVPVSWPIVPPRAASKLCHSCNSAAAKLFCRRHSAFFCLNCDAKIHLFTSASHHRVPACDVCEGAPAAVTCKADAASLCAVCDQDIHSVNPLARRHERVPIAPLQVHHPAPNKSAPPAPIVICGFDVSDFLVPMAEEEILWMNLNQNSKLALCPSEVKSEDVIFPDFDPLDDVDLPDPVSYGDFKHETIISYSDSVVPTDHCYISTSSPIANFETLIPKLLLMHVQPPAKSTHSPIHLTVVSDHHSSLTTSVGGGGDFAKNVPVPATRQISATEREARVLRYKEKRKNRKFEKTIRYASRKAYAETRPRIKGRFAKRRGDSDVFSDLLTF